MYASTIKALRDTLSMYSTCMSTGKMMSMLLTSQMANIH